MTKSTPHTNSLEALARSGSLWCVGFGYADIKRNSQPTAEALTV